MESKISELKADIAELESLSTQATRQKVKDVLSIEIRKLVSEVVKLDDGKGQQPKPQPQSVIPASTPKRCQIKLRNYAWTQTNKLMKFYVSLQNVHTIPAQNVYCTFAKNSFEVFVKDFDNKDYYFTVNNLLYDIDPNQSSWTVSTDSVNVKAAKVENKNWEFVTSVEKKNSDAKKLGVDKSSDPSDGLMSIMKNLYEQGDDEMKRTIAKTWTESQMKGSTF